MTVAGVSDGRRQMRNSLQSGGLPVDYGDQAAGNGMQRECRMRKGLVQRSIAAATLDRLARETLCCPPYEEKYAQ